MRNLFGQALRRLDRYPAALDDEDDQIGEGRGDAGVGDEKGRRRIENDVVVLEAEVVDQLPETLGTEQLRRIGRNGAAGQQVEIGNLGGLAGADQVAVADQKVGKPGRRLDAEDLVLFGLAHVAVDEQHAGRRSGRERWPD